MVDAKRMLSSRTHSVIVSLLSFKDSSVNEFLPQELQEELRRRILDAINEVSRFASDLLEPSLNDEYLNRLDSILEEVQSLKKE